MVGGLLVTGRGRVWLALAALVVAGVAVGVSQALAVGPTVYYAQLTVTGDNGQGQTLDVWRNTSLDRTTLQWEGDTADTTVVSDNTVTVVVDGAVDSIDTYPTPTDAWAALNSQFGITLADVDAAISDEGIVASEPLDSTATADSLASLTSASNAPTIESLGPGVPIQVTDPLGATGAVGPTGATAATGATGATGPTGARPAASAMITTYSSPYSEATHYKTLADLAAALGFPVPSTTSLSIADLCDGCEHLNFHDAIKQRFRGPNTDDSGPYGSICYSRNWVWTEKGDCDVTVDVAVPTAGSALATWGNRYKSLLSAAKDRLVVSGYNAAVINDYQAILHKGSTYVVVSMYYYPLNAVKWQEVLSQLANDP